MRLYVLLGTCSQATDSRGLYFGTLHLKDFIQMEHTIAVLLNHTYLGDNTINKFCRCDVKSWVPYTDTVGCNTDSLNNTKI